MSGRGGQEEGYLEDVEGSTGDIEDLVIPDVMNDVFHPKEDTLKILC